MLTLESFFGLIVDETRSDVAAILSLLKVNLKYKYNNIIHIIYYQTTLFVF